MPKFWRSEEKISKTAKITHHRLKRRGGRRRSTCSQLSLGFKCRWGKRNLFAYTVVSLLLSYKCYVAVYWVCAVDYAFWRAVPWHLLYGCWPLPFDVTDWRYYPCIHCVIVSWPAHHANVPFNLIAHCHRPIFSVFAFKVMHRVIRLTRFCKLLTTVAILSVGGGGCLKCLDNTTPLLRIVETLHRLIAPFFQPRCDTLTKSPEYRLSQRCAATVASPRFSLSQAYLILHVLDLKLAPLPK